MAWIGFIGLILDFIGVCILTIDILPEFLLHRREQRRRQLAIATANLKEGERIPAYRYDKRVLTTLDKALAMVTASNASLYDPIIFDFLTAQAGLNSSAHDFKAMDDDRVKKALSAIIYSKQMFADALLALQERSDKEHANFAHRRRPNLWLGIAFVLIGFLAQALGAMPPYAQAALINALLGLMGAPHS